MAVFSQNRADNLLNHECILNYDSQVSFKTVYVFLIPSGLILFILSSEFFLPVHFPAEPGSSSDCRCRVSYLSFIWLSWEVRAPHPKFIPSDPWVMAGCADSKGCLFTGIIPISGWTKFVSAQTISQSMPSAESTSAGVGSVWLGFCLCSSCAKMKDRASSDFKGTTSLWLCERFFVEDGGAGHVWKWKRWIWLHAQLAWECWSVLLLRTWLHGLGFGLENWVWQIISFVLSQFL